MRLGGEACIITARHTITAAKVLWSKASNSSNSEVMRVSPHDHMAGRPTQIYIFIAAACIEWGAQNIIFSQRTITDWACHSLAAFPSALDVVEESIISGLLRRKFYCVEQLECQPRVTWPPIFAVIPVKMSTRSVSSGVFKKMRKTPRGTARVRYLKNREDK